MSPSIQTLIDEFKTVIFPKVDFEHKDNLTLKELLPHLVNRDSKSDVKKTNFIVFRNEQSVSSKKLSIDSLRENEGGRAEEI